MLVCKSSITGSILPFIESAMRKSSIEQASAAAAAFAELVSGEQLRGGGLMGPNAVLYKQK